MMQQSKQQAAATMTCSDTVQPGTGGCPVKIIISSGLQAVVARDNLLRNRKISVRGTGEKNGNP